MSLNLFGDLGRPRSMKRSLPLLVAMVALLTPSPARAAASDTHVVGATLTASRTTLSGLQTAVLTLSVHLTDPDGVEVQGATFDDRPLQYGMCPCGAVAAASGSRAIELRLSSGTAQDGWWSGTTRIAADEPGTWTLTYLIAGTYVSGDPYGDWRPVDGAALGATANVRASHWPVSTASVPRPPVPYSSSWVASGRVTWSDTGAPIPNLRVLVDARISNAYWLPLWLQPTAVRTDANGVWKLGTTTASAGARVFLVAENFARDSGETPRWQGDVMRSSIRFSQHYLVRLSKSRSGGWVTLTAVVTPLQLTPVRFQRRTSSGWVTEAQVTRSDGHYATLHTQRSACWRAVALPTRGGEDYNQPLAGWTSTTLCT
jgi:hypothetical protein